MAVASATSLIQTQLQSPSTCTAHSAEKNTHIQPFYGSLDFVRVNQGEPVPEETFTHSHLSWSSVIPYLLPPSITYDPGHPPCSIYVLDSLFPQSLSKFSFLLLAYTTFFTQVYGKNYRISRATFRYLTLPRVYLEWLKFAY